MEQLTRLVTGTKAFESLWKQFSADRFAHAYLITGNDPEYLKEFLLYAGAMALCPKGGCFSCVVCNKVFAGEHVDVHVYPKTKDKILLADISEILDDCYVKPFEGDRKIYVLNNCDTLSPLLQNKLLKTLEEPPENTIFFLGATNESTILATVKSRCQQVRLDDTSFEEVMKYLTSSGISEADAEIAACFADGRPLTAEKYATDGSFYKIFDEVTETVKSLSSSKDALKASAKLSSYGAGTQTVLRMLLLLYRQTLAAYADEEMLLLKHKKNDILFIKGMYSPEALYRVVDLLTQAKIRLDGNCNLSAVIDGLVLSILEVKYSCRR